MKKINFFAGVLLVSSMAFTSCTHDDVANEQANQQEVVPQKSESSKGIVRIIPLEELEKMGIKNPYGNTSRSTNALSGYYFLPSNTGVSYFEKQGYAVAITRSWYDANTIEIQPLLYFKNHSYEIFFIHLWCFNFLLVCLLSIFYLKTIRKRELLSRSYNIYE